MTEILHMLTMMCLLHVSKNFGTIFLLWLVYFVHEIELHREKTGFLHMRKQRRRSASW